MRGGLFANVDGREAKERPLPVKSEYASIALDGSILFDTNPEAGGWDIWREKTAGESDPVPWLVTSSWEQAPSFSPDGRFVAYFSDESGPMEIYVRSSAGTGGRYQVSNQGGLYPRWSRDGKEIFFMSERSLWSAAVRSWSGFESDPPRKLFEIPEELLVGTSQFYDVFPDGHFVMVEKDPFELRPVEIVVIPDWIEEMKSRLGSR